MVWVTLYFQNRLWNADGDVDRDHGGDNAKLRKLCQFYGFRYTPAMFQSWIKLLKDLFRTKDPWCNTKENLPSSFWMNVLSRPDQFYVDPSLERLITALIVTPMGSSEAERAFR